MMNDTTFKHCPQCDKSFPATNEYFHRRRRSKDGLNELCKPCTLAKNREAYVKNREFHIARNRKYYQENRDKLLDQKSQYGKSNRQKINTYQRKRRSENPEKVRNYERQYRLKNPDKILNKSRKYYAENREEVRKYANKYYAEYRLKNLEASRNSEKIDSQNRRARKANLPDTLTGEQWADCVEYFEGKCVACGSDANLTIDHWIPLKNKDCPGTIASNIVPLCFSCNSSKSDRDAYEWATWKFGKNNGKKIVDKILAYFSELRGNNGSR